MPSSQEYLLPCFLDEFQDTTHVQYDVVKTVFLGSDTVLTAVGDNKQQIMRWAMALENPFTMFQHDFNARRRPLVSNYRSSPELVRIQHEIALVLSQLGIGICLRKGPIELSCLVGSC